MSDDEMNSKLEKLGYKSKVVMDLMKTTGRTKGTIVSLESKLWTDSLFVKNYV